MVRVAFEALQSWEVRHPRQREIARRHDAERGLENLTVGGRNRPSICCLVEGGRHDARSRTDELPELQAIRNMVDVAQDVGLSGETLRPTPVLLQLLGKGVGV